MLPKKLPPDTQSYSDSDPQSTDPNPASTKKKRKTTAATDTATSATATTSGQNLPPGFTDTKFYNVTADPKLFEKLDKLKDQVRKLMKEFERTPHRGKHFFVYLYLDPNILDQILLDGTMDEAMQLQLLGKAIFYIGKGCGTRPYDHIWLLHQLRVKKKKLTTEKDK
jgi:hypothetical protein